MSMATPMVASAHGVNDEPTGRLIEATACNETPECVILPYRSAVKAETTAAATTANVYIKICYDKPRDPSNYYRVIEENNCSSHDEWTP